MALAFDAATATAQGTGTLSAVHTPVGTPVASLVLIVQLNAVDDIAAVTYGGIACSEVALSPSLINAGAEQGTLYGYFLGSGVPSGAQTLSCTRVAPGTQQARAAVITLTGEGTVEVVDTSELDSASISNPDVNLDNPSSRSCYAAGCLFSGASLITDIAPDAGYTDVVEVDWGANTSAIIRADAVSAANPINLGWTIAAADEAGILAMIVAEVATGEPADALSRAAVHATMLADYWQ